MSALAEWKLDEVVAAAETNKKLEAVVLKVAPGLTERRIYLYASAKRGTNSDWYRLDLEVVLRRNGTPIATLPATVANHSGNQPSKSTATAFLGGGSPIQESIQVTIANPFGIDPNSVVLQPMKISAEADEVVLNMTGYTGNSPQGWRAIIGCLSTRD